MYTLLRQHELNLKRMSALGYLHSIIFEILKALKHDCYTGETLLYIWNLMMLENYQQLTKPKKLLAKMPSFQRYSLWTTNLD